MGPYFLVFFFFFSLDGALLLVQFLFLGGRGGGT